MSRLGMRSIFAACLLAVLATGASARNLLGDGAVSVGGFGMSEADYYGDVRSHMPFTQEVPPRPIGITDIERVRAARGRVEISSRHTARRRRLPHG